MGSKENIFEKFENSEAVEWCYHWWNFFLVNCNQLVSCKGLCLIFIAKGAG